MKNNSDLFEDNGAEFSDDRMYRYALWRVWNDSKPKVMFIGLNPSTANELTDDPTIRRVIRFAKDWGYGGVYMMNLFALVTTYPDRLVRAGDPIGDNDKLLIEYSYKCDTIVFAWGSFDQAYDRSKQIINMFPNGYALVINKDGSPRHPLYVRADVIPSLYRI